MAKKKTTTKAQDVPEDNVATMPANPGRITNPFYWCEQEVLEKVIRPKINDALESLHADHIEITSQNTIRSAMETLHNCVISASRFSEWLDKLGFICERKFVLQVPPPLDTRDQGTPQVVPDHLDDIGLPQSVQMGARARQPMPVPNAGGITVRP